MEGSGPSAGIEDEITGAAEDVVVGHRSAAGAVVAVGNLLLRGRGDRARFEHLTAFRRTNL